MADQVTEAMQQQRVKTAAVQVGRREGDISPYPAHTAPPKIKVYLPKIQASVYKVYPRGVHFVVVRCTSLDTVEIL